jgi:hypothetical protein
MPQETDERTRTRSLKLKRSEAHDHVRILTHVTVSPRRKDPDLIFHPSDSYYHPPGTYFDQPRAELTSWNMELYGHP